MVTPLPQSLLPPGVPELSMDAVCDRMPEVKVIHRLQSSENLRSTGLQPFCPEIAVVEAAEAQVPTTRSLHVHIGADTGKGAIDIAVGAEIDVCAACRCTAGPSKPRSHSRSRRASR
ncbi:hypothetical protein ACWGQ5_40540 [Streptomyces sp. NPDC055722]